MMLNRDYVRSCEEVALVKRKEDHAEAASDAVGADTTPGVVVNGVDDDDAAPAPEPSPAPAPAPAPPPPPEADDYEVKKDNANDDEADDDEANADEANDDQAVGAPAAAAAPEPEPEPEPAPAICTEADIIQVRIVNMCAKFNMDVAWWYEQELANIPDVYDFEFRMDAAQPADEDEQPWYDNTNVKYVRCRYGVKFALMHGISAARTEDLEPRQLQVQDVRAFANNDWGGLPLVRIDAESAPQGSRAVSAMTGAPIVGLAVAIIADVFANVDDLRAAGGVSPRNKSKMREYIAKNHFTLAYIIRDGDMSQSVRMHYPFNLIACNIPGEVSIEDLPYNRMLLFSQQQLEVLNDKCMLRLSATTHAELDKAAAAKERDDADAAVQVADAADRAATLRSSPSRPACANAEVAAGEDAAGLRTALVSTYDGDVKLMAARDDVVIQLGPFGIKRDGLSKFFGLREGMIPNVFRFEDMEMYSGAPNAFPTQLVKNSGREWFVRILRVPPGTPLLDRMPVGVVLEKETFTQMTEIDEDDLFKVKDTIHLAIYPAMMEQGHGWMSAPTLKAGEFFQVTHSTCSWRHQYGIVIAVCQVTHEDAALVGARGGGAGRARSRRTRMTRRAVALPPPFSRPSRSIWGNGRPACSCSACAPHATRAATRLALRSSCSRAARCALSSRSSTRSWTTSRRSTTRTTARSAATSGRCRRTRRAPSRRG